MKRDQIQFFHQLQTFTLSLFQTDGHHGIDQFRSAVGGMGQTFESHDTVGHGLLRSHPWIRGRSVDQVHRFHGTRILAKPP